MFQMATLIFRQVMVALEYSTLVLEVELFYHNLTAQILNGVNDTAAGLS